MGTESSVASVPVEDAERLCRELVQVPSVSGCEGAVADVVLEAISELGFDRAWRDELGNIIGQVGSGERPRVLFDAHLDTVGIADRDLWSTDPHGGERRNGRIYGRGSSDMKGSLAAMLVGLAAAADDIRESRGTVYLSGTVLEEVMEGVALGPVLDAVEPDVVIIGEATSLKLNIGQRGRAELAVVTHGKSAHSSNPEVGVNAVYSMVQAIERIRELPTPRHPVLGEGLIELTDIISTPYPGASVVPERCRVTYDRRLLVGETEETVIEPLGALLAELDGEVTCVVGEERTYTGQVLRAKRFFPGWLVDENEPAVRAARQALSEAGLDARLSHYSFCTNGSQGAGVRGIPTLGFGPSHEQLAHVVDEYVEEHQLHAAARGYAALALALVRL